MVVPVAKDMVTEGTLCIRAKSCSPDKGTNMQSSVASSNETGSSSENDDSTSDKEARRELGVKFENGISMLVSSTVPEGKGVSSSASVEVASMSAIAIAHGLSISSRDLALLCQKVKNHIVGAPCGVKMTSACGEAEEVTRK
ncbi:hypothetical protein Droror1_Dr00024351 [Drosera rotundifolia]